MSDDPQTKPHDRLFRGTFSDPEHAAGELVSSLPAELVAKLDMGSLRALDVSFIDAELRSVSSDLLFSVDLASEEAFICVLIEHQSTPDPLMGFRLLRYLVRLWERWLKENKGASRLPAVVPLVVHQGRRAWSSATTFHDLLNLTPEALTATAAHIPNFTYLVDDLAGESIDALVERPMAPFGRLVFVCLQLAMTKQDPLDELEPREAIVAEVVGSPQGRDAYATIVSYLLMATEVDPARLERFSVGLGTKAAEGYMTGAQQLEERGRKQGQTVLLMVLAERKFGAITEAQREKLAGLSPEETVKVAERILDADSFEDLFVD